MDEFEKTLVAAITSTDGIEALGKIVFDPVNAPAPKAYIRQVRKFANSSRDYMRIAIASGLAANLSINHFTPALQSVVDKLANDSDVPVRQSLAFYLAANPQLPYASPAVQVVSQKLRNDSDSTVRRMYQHGLCSNPSIGDMNHDTIDYLLSVLRTPSLLSQNVTILASNPGLPRFPHAILRLLRGVTEPDDIRFLVPGLAGNKSLPSFPPMMVRVLRNLAASPNVEMRDQMARCLGQNPRIKKASQPVLDILANLARDKEGRVSETLFSALSWNTGIDPNKDLPGIFKLLE